MELWCIIYTFFIIAVFRATQSLRIRRGFGGGSHAGLSNLGGYAPGYGSGPAGQAAGYAALQEITNNENIAFWSAQSAVASAVANDYRNQQATTAQFVHQFTVPVTKSQSEQLFGGKHHSGGKGGGHDGHRQGGHGGGHRGSTNNHNSNPWKAVPGRHGGGGGGHNGGNHGGGGHMEGHGGRGGGYGHNGGGGGGNGHNEGGRGGGGGHGHNGGGIGGAVGHGHNGGGGRGHNGGGRGGGGHNGRGRYRGQENQGGYNTGECRS